MALIASPIADLVLSWPGVRWTRKAKQMATPNQTTIKIHRYSQPAPEGWEGYVEPPDKSWILYFDDERALFYGCRDPETGAVVGTSTASERVEKCPEHFDILVSK